MEKQLNMPQPPPTDHPADQLWQKIEEFKLDDPTAEFPFSRKLAKENNWTEDFTKEAIKEYKRFVYLCCISPDGASPSQIVDEVWHLHLCYTVNYWEEFCEKTLCRKLHHHPSRGGQTEHKKHHDWNERTLTLYRQIFNEDPPAHIWQNTQPEKKQSRHNWNLSSLLPKRHRSLTISTLLIFPLISGCKGSGIDFLPPLAFLILMIVLNRLSPDDDNKRMERDSSGGGGSCGGSGCSSGCGSSCGGGCGGGCGGCGGGD